MGLTAISVTFLTAESPTRMDVFPSGSWSMVKSAPERLMSGGSTGIFSLKHSLMVVTTLSGCSSREFSASAMYSWGWWALK